MVRRRLDVELVRRGLADSRGRAHQAIMQRRVTVSGALAEKAARLVDGSEAIEVRGEPLGSASVERFVSRGGAKLAAALDRFAIDCGGKSVIDAGSSTGGFTDCVLARGARSVVAIDVGRNQLHEKLRANPLVSVYERTNIRYVQPDDVGEVVDLLVADLSFISLRTVAAALVRLVRSEGELVVLVKPQFEAGRAQASKGRGVIRDPAIWRYTLGEVCTTFVGQNAVVAGAMASPLKGADGNVEFLLHARAGEFAPATDADNVTMLDAAVTEAIKQQGRSS